MTPVEVGGIMLSVEGLTALLAAAIPIGLAIGSLMVLATLMYGRR